MRIASAEPGEIDELFDRVEALMGDKPNEHIRRRIAKLQRLVDESAASQQATVSPAHARLVQNAVEIMSANVRNPLTIVQLAAECKVSPTLLKQTFRTVMGMPVYRWYRSHRIERACVLLAETDLSIAQIAPAVGYSNSSKFAKAFRDETGVLPCEWRSLESAQD